MHSFFSFQQGFPVSITKISFIHIKRVIKINLEGQFQFPSKIDCKKRIHKVTQPFLHTFFPLKVLLFPISSKKIDNSSLLFRSKLHLINYFEPFSTKSYVTQAKDPGKCKLENLPMKTIFNDWFITE